MAVLSEDKKFIFFQNPRTGSTMLEKVLINSYGAKLFPVPKDDNEWMRLKHLTYNEFIKRGIMNESDLDGYFKFTTVRNPFTKVVSDWLGGKKFYKGHKLPQQLRIENVLAKNTNTLEEYLKTILLRGLSTHARIWLAKKIPGILFLPLAAIYCLGRILNPNKFLTSKMDMIIKTENIQPEFEIFCKKNGLPCTELPVINKTDEIDASYDTYHSWASKLLSRVMYADVFWKFYR